MTRNGKIARLPKAIRDRLNQQIHDGVPGKALVRWLNGLNEVVDILVRHFNSTRVTEQNLSEWKQGGYQDWLKQQERRGWVRRLSEEAEDIVEDAGVMPWMERVGAMFEVKLGKVVEAVLHEPVETHEQIGGLIQLSRELARHRQLSQDAARWRREEVQRRDHENPQDMDERIQRARNKALSYFFGQSNHEAILRQITEKMSPERRESFEKALNDKALEYLTGAESPGFADPVEDDPADEGTIPDPTKSDSIQPDPTSFPATA